MKLASEFNFIHVDKFKFKIIPRSFSAGHADHRSSHLCQMSENIIECRICAAQNEVKNFPTKRPDARWKGNVPEIIRTSAAELLKKLTEDYKQEIK